ncbi:(2Fe-2S) ferredoxin domain-containing protein [Amphibiibacter pelophylacis]|uniref:NAD(P)H-dependent oxidoreductase subunit E n=1 Tax=Amphibiibacter pelophylacis TaxID=1799477 RepID=A0ACC6NXY8_9BURK
MNYFERHIFFCTNQRDNGERACAQFDANALLETCKVAVKTGDLAGPGKVRVSKAGCLGRCAGGPVAVVYPESTWYSFVDRDDVLEVVEEHLRHGRVVERLVLPDSVGV